MADALSMTDTEKLAFFDVLGEAGLTPDTVVELINTLSESELTREWVEGLNGAVIAKRKLELDYRINTAVGGQYQMPMDGLVEKVLIELIGYRLTSFLVNGGIQYIHQLSRLNLIQIAQSEALSMVTKSEWWDLRDKLRRYGVLEPWVKWPRMV